MFGRENKLIQVQQIIFERYIDEMFKNRNYFPAN